MMYDNNIVSEYRNQGFAKLSQGPINGNKRYNWKGLPKIIVVLPNLLSENLLNKQQNLLCEGAGSKYLAALYLK